MSEPYYPTNENAQGQNGAEAYTSMPQTDAPVQPYQAPGQNGYQQQYQAGGQYQQYQANGQAQYQQQGYQTPPGQAPYQQQTYPNGYAQQPYGQPMTPPRNKWIAVLLCFFLGTLGIHNFYMGYTGRGVAQLLLTLTVVGALISGPWVFIEFIILLISSNYTDAQGRPLEN
ncbi:hypothetical protein BK816_01720 [Boudabousia tangfeifanii]|uniref:TM2 domain-containing protein n=1 Tax=Boudabousia tangfeifanii TaxID=1912795 RepID=A0A1D9MIQ8_9ACTO|nr:TM2 domain-containing protein [Boudabousia tangfeifanii]AOZ72172.1 hypothetical protein BK816_01720 [Boudabousia tangfeifanii]